MLLKMRFTFYIQNRGKYIHRMYFKRIYLTFNGHIQFQDLKKRVNVCRQALKMNVSANSSRYTEEVPLMVLFAPRSDKPFWTRLGQGVWTEFMNNVYLGGEQPASLQHDRPNK